MQQDHSQLTYEQLTTNLWQQLTRAPNDRHHDWRTPVLATQGLDLAGPQARTVVLRSAEYATWVLRAYTDSRSPKCSEIAAQPRVQLSFWSKRLNWQLRVSAIAVVDVDSDAVKAAWEKVRQSRAAGDYLSHSPPGHVQSVGDHSVTHGEPSSQKHHLAILTFKVQVMDWLALSQDGHRRARLTANGLLEWLVP